MPRSLSAQTTLETLRKEAKRWLKALRAGDEAARNRLRRVHPRAPSPPALRDVQHGLAIEYGCDSWVALKARAAAAGASHAPESETPLQALLRAASRGDAARVAEVLDSSPAIVNERGLLTGHSGLRTALHFGVHHEPVVRLLLERGADPNVRDEGDNAFPLHFAAESGNFPVIQLLVEHKAETTAGEVDGHELDIIGWATCFGRNRPDKQIVDYLVAHGATHTILSAVATGEVDIVRQLVAESPGILERRMDRTNLRRTPLHLAVVKRQAAVLSALLDLGASAEAVDAAGLTPLDQAALDGELDLAGILIGRGARIHLPAAVALDRQDDLDRLMREEPEALAPGNRWGTLIIRASERAAGPVIERLIRLGADVDVHDDQRLSVDEASGYTALHAAAFHGNRAAIEALLAGGARASRDGKYGGTPAAWAAYARKAECRDLILNSGAIDIFDAIDFDRPDRIPSILERDPDALNRPFGDYTTYLWRAAHLTPLAVATMENKIEAVRVLAARGAEFRVGGGVPGSHQERVASFLRMACLDWRVSGRQRVAQSHAAGRLLARHPEIAQENLYTAVVCGALDEVLRILAERPAAASEAGGPRGWPPLLYLCDARLPGEGNWSEHAPAIARALFDRGADANAWYPGGDQSIHYTALTCLVGRGEEQASVHPQARALAALLLERGAEPYDTQVLYNVFAGHASHRHLADDDFVWLLDLIFEHSVRRGREADWKDPDWPMLGMGGYGGGAWYLLFNALKGNYLRLAEWCLAHGANPNPPRAADRRTPQGTLYEQAVRSGLEEFAALLARFGAPVAAAAPGSYEEFVAACSKGDRSRAKAILNDHPEYLHDPAALFTAAEHDMLALAETLLDLGMSPDMPNPRSGNARALHMAAYSDARRVTALLVRRGAEVDPRDETHGSTPIYWALWGQKPGTVDLLAPYSRDVWVLTAAGKLDRLKDVLAAEPHLARIGEGGDSLLFYLPDDERAAAEMVRLLLQHGADPTVARKDGTTAEAAARARGLEEAADLLTA